MTWNYRVFREDPNGFSIHEVFYDEDGAIEGATYGPVSPRGDTVEELAQDIEWFRDALKLPILTMSDVPVPDEEEESWT